MLATNMTWQWPRHDRLGGAGPACRVSSSPQLANQDKRPGPLAQSPAGTGVCDAEQADQDMSVAKRIPCQTGYRSTYRDPIVQ